MRPEHVDDLDHAEFEDPRLVAVYDAECPWARDDDFFLAAVQESPGARVLDLGCGTGRLTIALAAAGHTVTGVDPARASLDAARAKPGADAVLWREETAADLPDGAYDVALMTSHVAQVFVDDGDWARTLADVRRALVPAGRLLFDTRDPGARAWGRWQRDPPRRVALGDSRFVEVSMEVTAVQDGRVSFTRRYAFPDGEVLASSATLRFRSEDEVRASLQGAGFVVDAVHGGWDRQPVGSGDGELVVVAHAAGDAARAARPRPAMTEEAASSQPLPELPPGQRAAELSRFGLPRFARRQVVSPARPVLTVGGQVRHATQVDLLELTARLPRRDQRGDLHCVTTWSALGLRWSGVPLAALLEELAGVVQPDPRAGWLSVTGLDGFSACLSLADATASETLLADRLDGEPLPAGQGGPVRLVAPGQYAYKSVKHVVALDYRRHYAAGSAGWMEHPRARVDREERSRVLPGRVWRPVWRAAAAHVRRRYKASS